MIIKGLKECLMMLPSIPYMPANNCTRDTYKRRLTAREHRIRQRIAALKNGLEPAKHLVDVFQRALEKEERKLHDIKQKRKALGQAIDAGPQTGVHVPSVHGHKRKASEEEPKASTRKRRQETPQAKTSRSGRRRTDAGFGIVEVDPQGCFEKIRRVCRSCAPALARR